MTRWSPDTCSCIVEYDDSINVTAVIRKCSKHAATPDDATHLATMLTHNRKKNGILGIAKAHARDHGFDDAIVAVGYDDADNIIVSGLDKTCRASLMARVDLTALLGSCFVKLKG